MSEDGNQDNHDQKPDSNWRSNLLLIIIALTLTITAVIFYPGARQKMLESRVEIILSSTPDLISETHTPVPEPSQSNFPGPIPTPVVYATTSQFGSLVLSIREGNDIHLFLYRPFLENSSGINLSALPLTRISSGAHQDITPAISPDGLKIAFASNRDGPWDLYILDLSTGETSRFTDTTAYEGNPTWSPDGKWLAYERYQLNNLDIFIQDIDLTSGAIPLTNHPGADYAPNWSGQGRKISFVSTRNGKQEIWYADLDSQQADKAVQVPGIDGLSVDHPSWSTDGRYLSWSIITDEGNHSLVTWDSTRPEEKPIYAGPGDWPIWGGPGEILFTVIKTPYKNYLTAYPGYQPDVQVMLPAIEMPGTVEGISWVHNISLIISPEDPQINLPTPLWEGSSFSGDGHQNLIELRNLDAPLPIFIEEAVSTFSPLRQKTRELAGWDFLSTLESAYLPLDVSLEPDINLGWLHTGRGLMINDIPRLADWLIVFREDYADKTFWRVYIKTNDQSGLHGRPIKEYPWDFNARYSGNNSAYENGGTRINAIPSGYWLDFTELAAAYGWSRFPAENHWQFSETASRYQYFAFNQGLSLESALLQLYSPEAIKGLTGFANP